MPCFVVSGAFYHETEGHLETTRPDPRQPVEDRSVPLHNIFIHDKHVCFSTISLACNVRSAIAVKPFVSG